MTGRGIDQILPHPSQPFLHEPFVQDAREYVRLAERESGPIPRPVGYSYIWGQALAELERMAADARIINLETSVTRSRDYWKHKGIHYRMHPANFPCITAADVDCCVLANNHVLDWGYEGLVETLETIRKAGVQSAGAGINAAQAAAPAVIKVSGKGRVVVFGYGLESSGIPAGWAASPERPGVNFLPELSRGIVDQIQDGVRSIKQCGDVVIASIHWGGNWGYEIPREHIQFAHALVDVAGIDIVHGHSSHHVKGIEVYNNRLILYGCGDFLNDYEGIGGYEYYRPELALMYFPILDSQSGRLLQLEMLPTRAIRFQITRASRGEALWLRDTLCREGRRFGTACELREDGGLALHWR